MVLAAVLGSLAGAAALFAYGLVDTVVVITRTVASGDVSTKGAKALMLYFIEIFDLFLLGTVMDFEQSKMRSGFTFRNPNQTGECDCGESVQLKPADLKTIAEARAGA